MDNDTMRSVGGSRMERLSSCATKGRSAQPWQQRINSSGEVWALDARSASERPLTELRGEDFYIASLVMT
jgi:hypothetical protein